jgi:serine phosphatase RsbU (regulator of sigma subunit)
MPIIFHKEVIQILGIYLILSFLNIQLAAQNNQSDIKIKIQEYNSKAEEFLKEGNLTEAAKYFSMSAFLLQNNYQYEEAIYYFKQVLNINEELNNKKGLMVVHNNIGMIYSDLERYNNALPYLKKGLQLSRELSDKEGIIAGLTNLALALQGLKRYEESNRKLDEAVGLAKEINNLKLLHTAYGLMYDNYDKLGDSEEAHKYFELYLSFDKEIKKQEIRQVKSEAKSEVSKAYAEKQLTEEELKIKKEELKITSDSLLKAEELTREQKLELELAESQLREERLKRAYISGVLIVISFFSIILTFLLVLIVRANKKIKNQKNTLDRQNKNIKASIRYAETIQQAILPEDSLLNNYFESFLIFRPKDIVSGDFYWFSKLNSYKPDVDSLFVAVVDCTGHGVPGAFMSMIGNSLLNEMINERRIESPKEILGMLNDEIRKSLRQDQTDNNDGMDLLLCRFDKLNKKGLRLVFAGAKRSLYIMHKENYRLIRLKGDRKSIGGVENTNKKISFKNHEVLLGKGDCVYLSTDGIIDQNGPDRKRFGSKRFEEMIVNNCKFSIKEQEENITKEIDNFMHSEEQRDDITLMGLRIL